MDRLADARLAELMRLSQDGDRRAYQLLLVEVSEHVRAFVRRRLRDVSSVEDVVQDTLLSVHRARHTYDPARPFGPWMYAIARHRLLDFAKREQRRSANEVHADIEGAVAPVRDRSLSATLERAWQRLSTRQRDVIRLLKVEEWTVAEIAVQTGLSQSLVKVTAHRGYQVLRKLLRASQPSTEKGPAPPTTSVARPAR